jgi:tRNA A-37 threonylcarbamoyl transferase component Bud32
MTPRGLILALKSPFSGPPTTGPRASALPPDLLREARRRLGILARLLIALAIVNVVLGHTLFPRLHVAWPVVADVIVASVTCVSLGVFLYTRRAMTDPESFVTLGLVYEVVVAAGVAAVEHVSLPESGMTGGPIISRLGMIILMFAAIVPSTPRRTLLTALIAASMDPLAMATAIAARHLSVAPAHLLWMHIPDVLAVAIATLISGVITRLGREVRDARELGSYRLGALLGRGGMGEVYVAHHRMLARPAAIKLIRPEKAAFDGTEHAQRVAQRFRREAEAAAGLRSPHTIELYDFGKTDDGTLYFVMELLDGIDLESLVERFGPLPPARTVHVLQQVCASLAEAHAQGLVHRDIKPANIHLCRMGLEHDFVKVLDFGIVKSRQPVTEGPQLATAADRIIGTPAFMPPEMATGGAVDGRADLYGVGCLGYWLLTGRLVFSGDTANEIIAQHIRAVPVPPSIHSPFPVDVSLDDMILECLAKDAERRPPDALAAARRFAACNVGEPWTEQHAESWWREQLPKMEASAVGVATGSFISHV